MPQALRGPAEYSQNLFAERIGDGGHILLAGSASIGVEEYGFRTFVFHRDTLTDLTATVGLRFDGGGINAEGVVAGMYTHGTERRTATWKDGRTTDVALASSDWTITSVYDLNDPGQILVLAQHEVTGRKSFLLLTPTS